MRRGVTALLLVALLGLAGCGGNEVAADEVPGSPPTLSLPPDEQPEADSGSSDDSSADSADEDTGADAGTTEDAATDTSGTGGTTAAPDTAATAAPEAPATGGTEPEPTAPESTGGAGGDEQQFEDFCNQNPGAC